MDMPKMQLVTAGGLVPITSRQLRALCANPRTTEFVVTGAARSWLYDLLNRVPGLWGTYQHEASKGVRAARGDRSVFWTIRRKKATSERGILIAELRRAQRDLERAIEGLLLEIKIEDELAVDEDPREPSISIEDLISGTAAAKALAEVEDEVDSGTFAALLGEAPDADG
jgi:hypothetical protein